MITLENVKKEFLKRDSKKKKVKFLAVNDISFKANDNEIIGILGPNGAGKTTLLRMIAGIMKPTSGKIWIDDMTYVDEEIKIKKQIAFLSGNTKLYDRISPYELLQMCGEFYQVPSEILEQRITKIFQLLNIEEFKNNKIGNLSTGQVQKVGIARCMIHNPKYYILDEATSGLDIIASQVILNFILDEKVNGKTILYSTHYMEEAEHICDRVIMMDHGNIIAVGTPNEIKKKTKSNTLREAFFSMTGGYENEN